MTTQRSDPHAEPAASGDPAAIRADIERTRAELGDTVQALAAKTDVKARAQDAAHAAKVRVRDGIARRPGTAAAIAGVAAAVTALLVLLGQRTGRRRAARRARARRGRSTRRG